MKICFVFILWINHHHLNEDICLFGEKAVTGKQVHTSDPHLALAFISGSSGELSTLSDILDRILCYVVFHCHALAWLETRCPPKLLYHSPSSPAEGRENTTKGSWAEGGTGRDHSPVTIMGKTESSWGN